MRFRPGPAPPLRPPRAASAAVPCTALVCKRPVSLAAHSAAAAPCRPEDGSFVRKERFLCFSAYLPWHADPVTKSGTHVPHLFLHSHLTTPPFSSQRFPPICNTLVTNPFLCCKRGKPPCGRCFTYYSVSASGGAEKRSARRICRAERPLRFYMISICLALTVALFLGIVSFSTPSAYCAPILSVSMPETSNARS